MFGLLFSVFCIGCIIKICFILTNRRCKNYVCMVGRTALITGGNSGLGLNLARSLAARGCTVVIADKANGQATVTALIKETRNPKIFYYYVDYASFKSVRTFAQEFKNKFNELHILANNAGVGTVLGSTEDNLEIGMQINYFSHFLLTHLLLDLLLKSAPSRILFSSSLTAYYSKITETDISGFSSKSQAVSSVQTYSNSKAALAMMSKVLSQKLRKTKITSNAHHPGLVKTNIFQANVSFEWKYFYYHFLRISSIFFGKTPEQGVQTLLHMATANELENVSGKFFIECFSVWQPSQVNDDKLCAKIWELSEKYTMLNPEEKAEIIIKNFVKM